MSVSPSCAVNAASLSNAALIRKGENEKISIFFRRRKWSYLKRAFIYCAFDTFDIHTYAGIKLLANCQQKVISIFLSEKFDAIPHPTHVPQAPSLHATKILRYAIHARYNYRGRECNTSGLICSQNSILGGLEARRARSIDLDE